MIPERSTFFRSYGVNLQSSFGTFLLKAVATYAKPPESDYTILFFLKQLLFDFKSKYFVPKYYSSSNIQLTINSRIYLCFRNSWPSLF